MSKLVEVKNLKKYFKSPRGTVHATDDVTFCIEQGKTMGIVGESGCGKSTLGRMLVHLEESTGGQIIFNNEDVTQLSKRIEGIPFPCTDDLSGSLFFTGSKIYH